MNNDKKNFTLGDRDLTKDRLTTMETTFLAANLNSIEKERNEQKHFSETIPSSLRTIATIIVIAIIILQCLPIFLK